MFASSAKVLRRKHIHANKYALWFGLHFACLLNKALNFGLLPVESGSPEEGVRTDVSLHMLFPFCDTLPCLVCLANSCSFCKTLLKCHCLLETSLRWIGALLPIS